MEREYTELNRKYGEMVAAGKAGKGAPCVEELVEGEDEQHVLAAVPMYSTVYTSHLYTVTTHESGTISVFTALQARYLLGRRSQRVRQLRTGPGQIPAEFG